MCFVFDKEYTFFHPQKNHIQSFSRPFLQANSGHDFQHIQSPNRDKHFPQQQDANHCFQLVQQVIQSWRSRLATLSSKYYEHYY